GGGESAGMHRRSSVSLGPHALGAQHGLGKAELPVELGHGFGLALDVEHRVDALALLVDLVRELAAAPDVDLLDRATGFTYDPEILLEDWGDGALLGLRVQDHHDLVTTHDGSPTVVFTATVSQ